MVLGLIPDCDLTHVKSIGNAAGTGALIALLSGAARAEVEAVVRRVEKVETAVEPRFQEHFVEALAIPHKSAPSTHLAAAVELPAPRFAVAAGREGGRRRRQTGPASAGSSSEPAADSSSEPAALSAPEETR